MLNAFLRTVRKIAGNGESAPAYPWNNAHYPLDLDASMKITRFETGGNYYPWPAMAGFIYEPVAEINNAWLLQAQGPTPFGPGVTSFPIEDQWRISPPLTKFSGTGR
jgi:hypothetical protein